MGSALSWHCLCYSFHRVVDQLPSQLRELPSEVSTACFPSGARYPAICLYSLEKWVTTFSLQISTSKFEEWRVAADPLSTFAGIPGFVHHLAWRKKNPQPGQRYLRRLERNLPRAPSLWLTSAVVCWSCSAGRMGMAWDTKIEVDF